MNNITRFNRTIEISPAVRAVLVPAAAALLVGSLVGAGAMLLWAPRSGRETRKQIRDTTTGLREKAAGGVLKAVKGAADRRNRLGRGLREKASDLSEHGREAIADQLGKVETRVKQAKIAVRP